MNRRNAMALALLPLALLAGCNEKGNESDQPVSTKTAITIEPGSSKSGLFSSIYSGRTFQTNGLPVRPGSVLGTFVSTYLGQEQILLTSSALDGIDAEVRLARAVSEDADETFALLQEYGTVLQVDLIDMLNRSNSRTRSLNLYLSSLTAMNKRVEEKITELEEKLKGIYEDRRNKKKEVGDLEKNIRHSLKEENYSAAGPAQESLVEKETELGRIESRHKLTKNIIDIYNDLLKVGKEREKAISRNMEILVVGLQVIEVPGIEDLKIIIKEY